MAPLAPLFLPPMQSKFCLPGCECIYIYLDLAKTDQNRNAIFIDSDNE